MTAADRAYAHAKERILDGRFAQGAMISEGEISDSVGVSRTPVREAFLRLESEGLLRLFPKRGALVVPVSAADVEQVMETRLVVERFSLQRVIELDVDLSDELSAMMARQQLHARAGERLEFVEADRRFHRVFVAATGNEILAQLHDSLRDRQSRMGIAALSGSSVRMEQILEEHRAIVAAVAERDADLAVTLIDDHLDRTLQLLRRARPGSAA